MISYVIALFTIVFTVSLIGVIDFCIFYRENYTNDMLYGFDDI